MNPNDLFIWTLNKIHMAPRNRPSVPILNNNRSLKSVPAIGEDSSQCYGGGVDSAAGRIEMEGLLPYQDFHDNLYRSWCWSS